MTLQTEFIPSGGVTTPLGFSAGVTNASIKNSPAKLPDLAILVSETPCQVGGVFTRNRFKAAPVILCRERLSNPPFSAIIVNSGNANAGNGDEGLADAFKTADLTARKLGLPPEQILVSSTGIIGQRLPMALLAQGIKKIIPTRDGGHDFSRAIMTTDTKPKEAAVKVARGGYIIGGAAKGSGMIHPNMGTMLCFLTTEASLDKAFLDKTLKETVDSTFNMITVDGDTSPNDTVLLFTNGLADNPPIIDGTMEANSFTASLEVLCTHLAKAITADGEGATKLIEVRVKNAANLPDARLAARSVAGSQLVKTAVFGNDPNWGRIVTAIGYSGANFKEFKMNLFIGNVKLLNRGLVMDYNEETASAQMKGQEVIITIDLNLGKAKATAWGCDLTSDYITINSQYTT
jgi:glutamate N-acetyltransferase/amino-acid N-acetyltransferase